MLIYCDQRLSLLAFLLQFLLSLMLALLCFSAERWCMTFLSCSDWELFHRAIFLLQLPHSHPHTHFSASPSSAVHSRHAQTPEAAYHPDCAFSFSRDEYISSDQTGPDIQWSVMISINLESSNVSQKYLLKFASAPRVRHGSWSPRSPWSSNTEPTQSALTERALRWKC